MIVCHKQPRQGQMQHVVETMLCGMANHIKCFLRRNTPLPDKNQMVKP